MQTAVSKELFETIVGPVLYEDESPYKLMMKKFNDFDIDYFNGPYILGDRLDETLNISVKQRIIHDFGEYGNLLIRENSEIIEERVKNDIGRWLEKQKDRKAALQQLDEVFANIHKFIRRQLNYIAKPMYTKSELKELYEAAQRVTLIERVTGSNDKDVIRYYHALISHTVWACRMVTRRRASQYLMHLVDVLSREFDMSSRWATQFDDAPGQSVASDASYQPQPVDTSGIVLSDDLLRLAECMAKNVHETWAATRIAQGWTYGSERDDAAKKHPCLVPYDQLPEEEKVYDRNTSLETLRFIISNGFEIINKTTKQ